MFIAAVVEGGSQHEVWLGFREEGLMVDCLILSWLDKEGPAIFSSFYNPLIPIEDPNLMITSKPISFPKAPYLPVIFSWVWA